MKNKKGLWITVIGVIVVVAAVCIFSLFYVRSEAYISRYVVSHEDELTDYAKELLDGGVSASGTYNGWDVDSFTDSNVVQFTVSYTGIVPASTATGFYYSPDDKLLGYQGVDLGVNTNGESYEGGSPYGNYHEVVKITDNWYWVKCEF